MPFVGMRKSTGERINILEVDDPRLTIPKGDIKCPMCEGELTVVAGAVVVKHFRHKVTCSSTVERHAESIEHLVGKWHVWNYCRNTYGDSVRVEIEVVIPEVNRQADLMVYFKTGYREAHEVQLSPITKEYLSQRTVDYLKAGIDTVVWWLGKSADTPTNRQWSVATFGDVRVIKYQNCTYDG